MNDKSESSRKKLRREHVTWKLPSFDFPVVKKIFKGNLHLPDELCALETPFQFFKYMFTYGLLNHIAEQTILYSVQKDPTKPYNTNSEDLSKFIGICILPSVMSSRNTRLFWNPAVGLSVKCETMSVNEFEKLRQFLHFNDNSKEIPYDQPNCDNLHKICPVIESLKNQFSTIPLEENLAVDEQMCATKSRHYLKQYMPDKPHKWGYKIFMLCGTSGFTYDFEIYTGQENLPARCLQDESDLGASSNVVVRLTQSILKHVGHKSYFDNYYTSLHLMTFLASQGILFLGTVRRNRIPDCTNR
ncbi:piggyBac transposable element-derived protein 4-like [Schistocerca serialis cubense]|uniref:piggyBac transposable element-derived protein 4-like n=1 Tax=Schistocerca serialis cubense TaxID=2023355 RepID=UPI00214E4061|nr:piggyBac transposable element-derived protein 4-like [Schistocerca serialis cubense]